MANFPTEGDDHITGGDRSTTPSTRWAATTSSAAATATTRLFGGDGDDRLYGENGNDLLIGNSGADKMFGGWGDDTMVWNNGDGSDLMEGGNGYDTAVVNGSDTAGDEFTIAPNGDRVDFDRVNLVPFSLDIGTTEKLVVNGQGGDDIITGSAGLAGLIKLKLDGGEGNDSITGGDGDDALYGGNGDDVLVGFRGDDKMFGGWGDDRMVWNNGDGSDLMEGGEGYDVAEVNGSDTDGDEFTIAANGHRVAFDRVNLVPFSLDIGTTERLEVNGQGGDDTITAGDGLKRADQAQARRRRRRRHDHRRRRQRLDYGGWGDDYSRRQRLRRPDRRRGLRHLRLRQGQGRHHRLRARQGHRSSSRATTGSTATATSRTGSRITATMSILDLGKHELKVEDVSWLKSRPTSTSSEPLPPPGGRGVLPAAVSSCRAGRRARIVPADQGVIRWTTPPSSSASAPPATRRR